MSSEVMKTLLCECTYACDAGFTYVTTTRHSQWEVEFELQIEEESKNKAEKMRQKGTTDGAFYTA